MRVGAGNRINSIEIDFHGKQITISRGVGYNKNLHKRLLNDLIKSVSSFTASKSIKNNEVDGFIKSWGLNVVKQYSTTTLRFLDQFLKNQCSGSKLNSLQKIIELERSARSVQSISEISDSYNVEDFITDSEFNTEAETNETIGFGTGSETTRSRNTYFEEENEEENEEKNEFDNLCSEEIFESEEKTLYLNIPFQFLVPKSLNFHPELPIVPILKIDFINREIEHETSDYLGLEVYNEFSIDDNAFQLQSFDYAPNYVTSTSLGYESIYSLENGPISLEEINFIEELNFDFQNNVLVPNQNDLFAWQYLISNLDKIEDFIFNIFNLDTRDKILNGDNFGYLKDFVNAVFPILGPKSSQLYAIQYAGNKVLDLLKNKIVSINEQVGNVIMATCYGGLGVFGQFLFMNNLNQEKKAFGLIEKSSLILGFAGSAFNYIASQYKNEDLEYCLKLSYALDFATSFSYKPNVVKFVSFIDFLNHFIKEKNYHNYDYSFDPIILEDKIIAFNNDNALVSLGSKKLKIYQEEKIEDIKEFIDLDLELNFNLISENNINYILWLNSLFDGVIIEEENDNDLYNDADSYKFAVLPIIDGHYTEFVDLDYYSSNSQCFENHEYLDLDMEFNMLDDWILFEKNIFDILML